MDSSLQQGTAKQSFTPWQIGRMKDRLMNYKGAKRHGWERIATDILFEEELSETYVDSEDVRPLSESLRRLANGSQTPSEQRLHAVELFLISQGYLGPSDLEQVDTALQAPLAFRDFIISDGEDVFGDLSSFSAFEGTYSHVHTATHEVRHEQVSLVFDSGIFTVTYQETFLKNIDSLDRLLNVSSVRNRAISRDDKYSGWAVCGPFGQIILVSKAIAYAKRPKFFMIWAETDRDDSETHATKLLLLPYDGVRGVEDIEAASNALNRYLEDGSEVIGLTSVTPRFQLFARSEGRF
ncbi:MAG: hypothetical protein RIC85_04050 [Gammaproteobacteria bacterium]